MTATRTATGWIGPAAPRIADMDAAERALLDVLEVGWSIDLRPDGSITAEPPDAIMADLVTGMIG